MIRFLASFLAGSASVLAFAPYSIWLITLPCLAVLFVLLYHAKSTKEGLLLGYSFGLGLFGFGVYWIYYSLHLFGSAIAPLAAVGTLLFVALMAVYIGLFGWLSQKLPKQQPVLWCIFGVPALWLLIEWFRSWFLTGFPWLSIGYSTIETPLAGYAPVGGVYLNSLMLALICGAVAAVIVKRTIISGAVSLALVGSILLGGYQLGKIQWTEAFSEPVTVTMVQGNIAQEMKFLPNLLEDSLRTYSEMSNTGSELIIWPESAIPTFYSDVAQWEEEFSREMKERGSTVISGGFHASDDYSEYYNAIKVLGGTDDQIYTKRHLVPFGEFIPFRNIVTILSELIDIPMSDLSPGKGPVQPIDINGVKYGMSICYEDAFGSEIIKQLPEANVLINVSNDAWFGDSSAPHQHQEIAAMRALETGRPLIRATNTGISSFISSNGKIIESAAQYEQTSVVYSINPRRGNTPYSTIAGSFTLVFSLLGLGLLILCVRKNSG